MSDCAEGHDWIAWHHNGDQYASILECHACGARTQPD